jgi:tRNA nucleotidyltransferase (CCA-adding enzyme)
MAAKVSRSPMPLTSHRRAIMPGVPAPPHPDLLERLAALPAARPLLAAAGDADGVFLVGGAVRDLLRGAVPADLDLVVDRDLAEVISALGAPARSHERFGTATVVLDGTRYDLARARRERYPRPGALPEVEPAPLEEDLGRRDFTVNAVALGLGGERRGQLVVVPRALDDLDGRVLRVLHDESFVDDPTRLLRLARYGARLGFAPEPHTARLARAAIAAGAPATVSGPRLGTELRLAAREQDPVAALSGLRSLGVDEALIPGFGLRDPALASRALEILPGDGDPAALVLAAAALGVEPDQLAPGLDRLAFDAETRNVILATVAGAGSLAAELEAAGSPSVIAGAARGAPSELVALAGALGPASAAARWLGELRHVALEIDGTDLLSAGVTPGPQVGAGLRAALAAKLDGLVAGREAELAEGVRAAGAGR